MSDYDRSDEDFVGASIERTRAIRDDVYVGVSPSSFADAAEKAWEAAKQIAADNSAEPPATLYVVAQWVNATNPITDYVVVTIGRKPTG